eukprot:TRINITY_DN82692_c0_g1_i1.p1 TRINITY_DN82692_c0_g1~~TRINITY_DN82692_c0_g1_i1.p1  ORF type:complete len:209 (+),score=47.47 TRINITY_DN82692_c0_g1_i1:29-655(+)
MAWGKAASAWAAAAVDAWLFRQWRTCTGSPAHEQQYEAACAELLNLLLQGAPAGVPLARPWQEFTGEMRLPDHPAQRVPSNLERYAGNYINMMFGLAMVFALTARPLCVVGCAGVKVVALLAPPEIFDIDVLQSRKAGGGFRPVGGAWIRYALALSSQGGLWLCALLTRIGSQGLLLGIALTMLHAYFRIRPWTDMAKERLGLKGKSQ